MYNLIFQTNRIYNSILYFSIFIIFSVLIHPNSFANDFINTRSTQHLNVTGVVPLSNDLLQDRIDIFFDDAFDSTLEGSHLASHPTFPVKIEPALEGEIIIQSNRLSIIPKKLEPEIIYQISLHSYLKSSGQKRINPAHQEFKMPTSAFEMQQIWEIEEKDNDLKLGISFSLPVELNTLKENLTVKNNGDLELQTTVEGEPVGKTFTFTVYDVHQYPIKIMVPETVAESTGLLSLQEDVTRFFPSNQFLTVQQCRIETYQNQRHTLQLRFSAPVKSTALDQYLHIRDESGNDIAYTIPNSNHDQYSIAFEYPVEQEFKVYVEIAQGLQGSRGRTLQEDYEYLHTIRANRNTLNIQSHYFNNREKDGMELRLYFNEPIRNLTTVEDLEQYITITPELENIRFEMSSYRSISIYGDWVKDEHYTVIIDENIPLKNNVVIHNSIRRSVVCDYTPAWTGFDYEGKYYFPKKQGILLPALSRNTTELDINTYRLFPSNFIHAVQSMQNGDGSSYFNTQYCELIGSLTREVIAPPQSLTKTWLDLDEILPSDKRGVLALEINNNNATKLILHTNIGVITHWQNDELLVFAHDLFSLTPLSSAKVSVYSNKYQLIGSSQTGYDGTVNIPHSNPALGEPMVVVIEHSDDFSFLELNDRSEGTESIQRNAPYFNDESYDAYVYADRNLYRPGETVNLHWIVRDHDSSALANVPLILQIIKPNGKDLLNEPVMLSELGSGEYTLETQKAYPTGNYTARIVVPGSKKNVGSFSFKLEEFVPNQMKVMVKLESPLLVSGIPSSVTVEAQHLFGGPVIDRKSDARIIFQHGAVKFDQWNGYHFSNDENFVPGSYSLGEMKTSEQGAARFTFTYSAPPELTSPVNAIVVGNAYELGGRSVSSRAKAVLAPDNILLGLTTNQTPGSKALDVHVAAIQLDQSPADVDSVEVTLERQEWSYYVSRYYSHNQPNWTQSFEVVETKTVSISDGRGLTSFEMNDYGYYRIRVHSKKSNQYSTQSFYSYRGRIQQANLNQPSLIKIQTDKVKYLPGDEAVIRIESPFDGSAFVVLQNKKFIQSFLVPITDQVGTITIPIKDDYDPNIWVEATVIRKVDQNKSQVYPYSSFTMIPLHVEQPTKQLTVELIDFPDLIRPESTTSFTVQVNDHEGNPIKGEVTLAAVDEGIHDITLFQSPDPFRWFTRMRNPTFNRAHYYDHVLYDFEKPKPGGGLALAAMARVSPDLKTWIDPVALWSGTVITDENGLATVDMIIPDYIGSLRVDVVAYNQSASGSTSDKVPVKSDHTLQVSLPRFLYPGDSAQSTAVLYNHTGEVCSIELQYETSGALISHQDSVDIVIPPNSEHRHTIELTASPKTGQGEIIWTATIKNEHGNQIEQIIKETPMPVYQPAAYESQHEIKIIKPGETLEINNETVLDNEFAQTDITISANPALRIQEAFAYITNYPYGCVEQTTSQLMPLYILRTQKDLLDSIDYQDQNIESYIQAGIDRLFSMQTSDGGLGMWPGANASYPYGSVYAFHFLTIVKNDREINIPHLLYNDLKNYVNRVLSDWNDTSQPAYYQRAYALFVLSLSGDTDAMNQIGRFDDVELPRAARFLLAAALMRSTQDKDRVAYYLANRPSAPYLIAERDGTLNSDIRNTAIEMIALQQTQTEPEKEHELALKLIDYLEAHNHGNTQETAFIVTALGSYFNKISDSIDNAKAEIQLQKTQTSTQDTLTGNQLYQNTSKGKDSVFMVQNTGDTDLFVNITYSGIPTTIQTDPVNKGIALSRSFSLHNQTINNTTQFESMKEITIQITVTTEENIENVVLVDLLPAGFEVQNPRLDPTAADSQSGAKTISPTYMDVRDDRLILMFDQLQQGTHTYQYAVKTVTPGTYDYPPIQAECMYDASVYGRSAYSKIQVTE